MVTFFIIVDELTNTRSHPFININNNTSTMFSIIFFILIAIITSPITVPVFFGCLCFVMALVRVVGRVLFGLVQCCVSSVLHDGDDVQQDAVPTKMYLYRGKLVTTCPPKIGHSDKYRIWGSEVTIRRLNVEYCINLHLPPDLGKNFVNTLDDIPEETDDELLEAEVEDPISLWCRASAIFLAVSSWFRFFLPAVSCWFRFFVSIFVSVCSFLAITIQSILLRANELLLKNKAGAMEMNDDPNEARVEERVARVEERFAVEIDNVPPPVLRRSRRVAGLTPVTTVDPVEKVLRRSSRLAGQGLVQGHV